MRTQREPRPEKVAVVEEVRERLATSEAALLTDFRGIDVKGMNEIRGALREAGGEMKIYKNTLVRAAARDLSLELDDLLVGPTAVCFVARSVERRGDPAKVAKVLKEFSSKFEGLTLKGGVLGDRVIGAADAAALADIPPREQLFAAFAGAMESILAEFAGLLDAKLREFAWAMQELLDKGGPQGPGGGDSAGDATREGTAADDETVPSTVREDQTAGEE